MSAIDRSRPPAAGAAPRVALPRIERARAASGMRVSATPAEESPELLLQVAIPAGRVREPLARVGLSTLTAQMLQEGTQKLSTVEWIDALDFLGAEMGVHSNDDEITVSLRVLEKHAERALELLADVLLSPRMGEREFERVRELRRAALRSRIDDAKAVAGDVWARLYWGRSTALGGASIGDESSWKATTLDDVRSFHSSAMSPRSWRCMAACRGGLERALRWLAPLEARLAEFADGARAVNAATWCEPWPLTRQLTRIYLVDRPGAPQSELHVGHPSVASSHPAWLPLTALNLALGGVFSSRLNLNLRETRGFTYGVRSGFNGGRRAGPFLVSTSVHTQSTVDALREIENELTGFVAGPTDAEVAFVRSSLQQSLARQFETPGARLTFVETVERNGLADDYPLARLAWLEHTPLEDMAKLLAEHLRPGELTIVVVGDRAQIERGLAELGHGSATRLDARGDELAR